MRNVLGWTSALLVALAACAAGQGRMHAPPSHEIGQAEREDTAKRGGIPVVRYDEPFTLAFGNRARIEHGDTRVRFAAVLEDSRCPADVRCIQAGRARVRLEVTQGRRPVSIELSTDPEASMRSAGGVTWELRNVAPYPVSGRERHDLGYVLTLVAHPLGSR
jgi:hypothetical protein